MKEGQAVVSGELQEALFVVAVVVPGWDLRTPKTSTKGKSDNTRKSCFVCIYSFLSASMSLAKLDKKGHKRANALSIPRWRNLSASVTKNWHGENECIP